MYDPNPEAYFTMICSVFLLSHPLPPPPPFSFFKFNLSADFERSLFKIGFKFYFYFLTDAKYSNFTLK